MRVQVKRPGPLVGVIQIGLLLAAAAVAFLTRSHTHWNTLLFILLFVGSIASDLGAQKAPASAIRVSGSFLALVLAGVLLGGSYAVIIGAATVLAARTRESVPAHFFRQNLLTYCWYPLASGLIFHWLVGLMNVGNHDPRYYLIVCVAFVVALSVNFIGIVGYSSWIERVSFPSRISEALLPVLPGEMITALLTVGITFLYVRLGIAALILFGIVLLSYEYLLTELLISQQRELTVREKEAETNRYAAQQAAVAALGARALEGGDVETLAREAIMLSIGTLQLPIAAVLELDQKNRSWAVRAAEGVPALYEDQSIPIFGAPTEADYAIKQRDPLVVQDWSAEERFVKTALLANSSAQSTVVVSLDSEGEVIGVVIVGSPEVHEFTPDEIGFMQAMANVLATAVQRKRAADELDQTLIELRRTSEERRKLLRRLVQAQEEERQRIAADIHDDSVQTMAVVSMRLETLRRKVEDAKNLKVVEDLQEDVALAIDRLRHLLFELTPQALEAEGLGAALTVYLRDLEKDAGIKSTLNDAMISEPPHETGLLVYRISQEILANVRKHAKATHVKVDLNSHEGGIRISIADNGVGFVPEETHQQLGHLGLSSIRQRAETAGGWATIESEPGVGTTVEFWVPDIPVAEAEEDTFRVGLPAGEQSTTGN